MKHSKFTLFLTILCVLSLFNVELKSTETIHPYDISGDWNGKVEPFTRIEFPDGRKIEWRDYGTRVIEEPATVTYRVGNGTHPSFPHNPKRELKVSFRKFVATKPEPLLGMAMLAGRRRVLLYNSPVYYPAHEPGAVSLLTSVLRKDGHKVRQRWGHIIGLEYMLTKYGGERMKLALPMVRRPNNTIHQLWATRKIFEEVSESIPTKDRFRFERNNVMYQSQYQDGTIRGALNAIADRKNHLWYPYFSEVEVPLAHGFEPDVYGISIGDEKQLFPGLVLASMIKDRLPDCKVIVGGNFFGRMPDPRNYPDFVRLFDHLDAVVYAEGFQPLQHIVNTLNVGTATGTIWKNGDEVVRNPRTEIPTEFESLPTPSSDGEAVQWAPETVRTLYTESHCPLACDFCAIEAQSDGFAPGRLDDRPKVAPRSMTPKRIAGHMRSTGAHKFDIVDALMSIPKQLELGKELRAIGYEATWQCYLTVGKHLLDPQVAKNLYEAGCRSVQLGLETLCKDTLFKLHKQWNNPQGYDRILKNFRDAGIHTHVFLMIGIPIEPLHEGLKWVGFLEKYGRNILTIKSARWRPARYAPEVENGLLDATVELYPDTKPFQTNRSFRYRNGTHSNTKVDAMRDILEQACRRHWAYAVTSTIPWWINRSRYTWEQLEEMAKQLPSEPDIPHLNDRIAQMRYLVRTELGREANFRTWEELAAFAVTLL